jgi:DNA-directed RNA polymerase subunit K/omega
MKNGMHLAKGVPLPEEKKKPDKYEIDNWTRTLIEAIEIMNDPRKMKYVKTAMSEKHKAIMSFDDLREKIEAQEA